MATRTTSSELLAVARRAALSVNEQLLTAFRTKIEFGYKRDFHDIVTLHDRAAEDKIRSVILDAVPDSTFVGEEGGRQGSGSVVWYVDPIDGTSNFARGIAQWCVSIAAATEDRLVAGVIFEPVAGNLFSADPEGAWLNGSRISADASRDEQGAVLLTGFPNARHLGEIGTDVFAGQAELLNAFLAVRNLGSGALHLAHVAAGWSDAALGFSTNAWDVAAGVLLVHKAGGRFVGVNGGEILEPAFLAADYFAVGSEADYPTLERVAHRLSRRSSASRQEDTAA
jgi:myo-inositol-1(or 4)-monophosphatase